MTKELSDTHDVLQKNGIMTIISTQPLVTNESHDGIKKIITRIYNNETYLRASDGSNKVFILSRPVKNILGAHVADGFTYSSSAKIYYSYITVEIF